MCQLLLSQILNLCSIDISIIHNFPVQCILKYAYQSLDILKTLERFGITIALNHIFPFNSKHIFSLLTNNILQEKQLNLISL